jgi:hypothetical protein
MRGMFFLVGIVTLFLFPPVGIIFLLIAIFMPARTDRVGDIRRIGGVRAVLGQDGQWYRLE